VEITDCLANNCYKVGGVKTMRPLPFKIHASRLKCHTALQQQSHDREHDQISDVGLHIQSEAKSVSSSTVRPTSTASATASNRRWNPMPAKKLWQTPSLRRIDQPDFINNSTSQQWHAIKRIAARCRAWGGMYLYEVQYLDNSITWLPACDIDPSVICAINARKRRHRLW